MDGTIYRNFDGTVPELGANVEFRSPIDERHTPRWQREALAEWKENRKSDDKPLNRERLDQFVPNQQMVAPPRKDFRRWFRLLVISTQASN